MGLQEIDSSIAVAKKVSLFFPKNYFFFKFYTLSIWYQLDETFILNGKITI